MLCSECGEEFDRERNIYGTFCPYCHSFIKAEEKPEFIKEYENKKDKLKKEILEKIRKKIKEKE